MLAVVSARRPLSRLFEVIFGGCVHALGVQLRGNIASAIAACRLAEKTFDYLGGGRVDYKLVLIVGRFGVAEGRLAPHKLALFGAGLPDGAHFLGYVLCVHFIEYVLEGSDIVIVLIAVIAVVDRHIPDAVFREEKIRILSGHNVVTAQVGKVFGQHNADIAFFNVLDHPLEIRTLKIRSSKTVVYIDIINLPPSFFAVRHEHIALVPDAHALGAAVLVVPA